MKKHFLLLIILFWASNLSFAQSFQVNENSFQRISITFTPSQLEAQVVKSDNGIFTRLLMEDCTPSREIGKPELPVLTKLVEIPLCNDVVVTIKNAQYREFDADRLGIEGDLYPAQHSQSKSHIGPNIFDKDENVYRTNDFYGLPLASVEKIGVMRDINLANITISPVYYNPITRKVRVFNYIDVEITFVNVNVAATHEMQSKHGSPLFKTAHRSVINPTSTGRREITNTPIKYLIIAHSMFEGNADLQEFISWKKRMGYLVEVAYTNDPNVGTTTNSIKNFIQSHYTNATATNPAPTFLLLVGDVQQIPAFDCSDGEEPFVSDNYYAEWTGDYLPDCYHGRFSAQDISQLTPQIEKTLMYEQYTMPDPSYLGKAIVIAGYDPTWAPTHANGQLHYISENYLNTNNGYDQVYVHPYDCRSEANAIRKEISAGLGWGNYSAHGLEDGWLSPAFNNSHIESMNNEGKYGILIGNCCLTGKFDDDNCFGEALLRAEHKGTMGYIGASSTSYWNEDYYWAVGLRNDINANPTYDANHLGAYDRMFHLHNEAHSDWFTTMGGMIHAGNLAVQSSSSEMKQYYWEVYQVFGDPSVKLYQSIPDAMNINSADNMVIGSINYSVTAVPYAYVALTHENELIAAAFADGHGHANLTFDPLTIPGEYELAVSAQNYIQYFKPVNVTVSEGSYVIAENITMTNLEPTPESSIQWDITLKNFGTEAATNVSAEISTDYAGVTITQPISQVGNLAVDGSITIPNAFAAILPADAHDQDAIPFTVTAHYDGNNNTRNTQVVVVAPRLTVTNFTATNAAQNTNLHAGDAITVNITNTNNGHYIFETGAANLSTQYSGVSVISGMQGISNLDKNQSVTTTYTLQVSDTISDVVIVPLYYSINNNDGICLMDTFYIAIGDTVETWESHDFSTFPWNNSNKYPWQIVSNGAHSGRYCARSYKTLPSSSTSTMTITLTSNNDGIFSYFHKVSSEANCDIFTFSIDGVQKEKLSGSKPWAKSKYFVPAGTHTYTFSYSKDPGFWFWGDTHDGSDCVWIDDITFPGMSHIATDQNIAPQPEIVTACESFDWHGTTYTESGIYTYEQPAIDGESNATETLYLTINLPVELEPEIVTACESYYWHNEDYFESGIYTFVRNGKNGECDTTETLKLTINQPVELEPEIVAACELFTWHGTTYTQSGTYTFVNEGINGECNTTETLILTINQPIELEPEIVTACESYYWHNETYFESGIYTFVRNGKNGECDTTETLKLTINQPIELEPEIVTACESFTWHGTTYTQSGTYNFVNEGINGECNTTETLILTINNPIELEPEIVTVCESYNWHNQDYFESGIYHFVREGKNGECDTTETLKLTINQPSTFELTETACESYVWNGKTYTQSGNYKQIFVNANGCDSIVTLHLTINHNSTFEFSESVCEEYTWNEKTYTQSGDYEQTFENVNGCDSVVTLHLTINHASEPTEFAETINETYNWNGYNYTESGDYTQTLTNVNGCDSIVTLHLTIYHNSEVTEFEATACETYIWNQEIYNQSGNYFQHFTNMEGGDSTVVLHLTINQPVELEPEIVTACESYNWHNEDYYESGIYNFVRNGKNGECDTTETLKLTINHPVDLEPEVVSACESFIWHSKTYTQSGTYNFVKEGINGECNTTETLILTINQPVELEPEIVTACESYYWHNQNYYESGIYNFVRNGKNGECDTTETLKLTINQPSTFEFTETACESYVWNEETYTQSGDYEQTFENTNGCDSIVILHLTINQPVNLEPEIVSACESFTWNGTTYTESGKYTFINEGINGECNTTETLILTIHQPVELEHEIVTACGSYNWHNEDYVESGIYTFVRNGANGECDTTETLNLTINQASEPTEFDITATDFFVWNEVTYNHSGDFTQTFTNMNGCDSVITLHLTIYQDTENTEWSHSACETYTWNGESYDQSGDYTQTLTNVDGGDSTVTLHLAINHEVSLAPEEISACRSFTWHGHTYNRSGFHVYFRDGFEGECDTMETLFLTINRPVTRYVPRVTACESYTWHGQTYTESGTYRFIKPGMNGECDTTEFLRLTITQPTKNEFTESACGQYAWNGKTYTQSGTYTMKFIDAGGCNCASTLHLTVWPRPDIEILTDNNSLSIDGNRTLTCSGAESYVWSTGEMSNSIEISPETTTTYSVIGTDEHGCSDTTSIKVPADITGIDDYEALLTVSPNPATSFVKVSGQDIETISLYDPIGKLLEVIHPESSTNATISLSNYTTGHYFLQIKLQNGKIIHKKIILAISNW